MVEIAKCRICGSAADKAEGYWFCSNPDCRVYGPSWDTDGTKWNALMAPASPEPAAGTVRVRIPVYLHGQGRLSLAMQYRPSKGWEDVVVAKSFVSLQPVAYITADIPLPQPVEIPGTVESGS